MQRRNKCARTSDDLKREILLLAALPYTHGGLLYDLSEEAITMLSHAMVQNAASQALITTCKHVLLVYGKVSRRAVMQHDTRTAVKGPRR